MKCAFTYAALAHDYYVQSLELLDLLEITDRPGRNPEHEVMSLSCGCRMLYIFWPSFSKVMDVVNAE